MKDKRLNKMVSDDREDILLDAIGRQENSLIVCVYGGAHTWEDIIPLERLIL